MTGLQSDVLQSKLCINNCECIGFVPILTYAADGSAKTVTVTDASTFGTGDSFKSVNVWVFDKLGNYKTGHISAAAGVATINVTGLDLTLLDIKGTVVSTAGCKTDLGTYDVSGTSSGSLLNKSYQGNGSPKHL